MPASPRNVKDLFVAALDLPDAESRAAFLDRECAADPDMRHRLEVLLRAHDDPASVVDRPLVAPASNEYTGAFVPESPPTATVGHSEVTADHTPQPDAGMVLGGKYKLVEEIGEGGMGTVWVAQQTEPVRRVVAVKLIKPGMDSKAVLARFEAERQALALMDHPNIARVLDGGATPDGRPYFVMELVKGVPITRFCDERKLTPRQRLELFVPVCQAIQHAHQKGVVHRDIKPSNVLIALYDDKPVPKVIDFGIAKATGQTLTDKTLMTGFGAVVGTPEYMSPEQASLNNLDIDTRSDVYSLGVLLYELLAGSPPFRSDELKKAGLLEMLRVVREEEPPRPSTKLSTASKLPSISADRGTEPRRLTGLLRNELDWIVMKSLEKDRARRYETVNGFAADVQRYLSGEAVQAHPPSAAYRIKKFARKNRVALTTATAFVALLITAAVVSGWQAVKAKRAEGFADEKRVEAEKNAKEAERNAAISQELAIKNEVARIEAEITATQLQVDLDLSELRTDRRVGLLRLARPRKKIPLGKLILTDEEGNSLTDYVTDIDFQDRNKALREFVTAAVLATGQDYAPLLPRITHDGQPVVQLHISPDGRHLLTLGADKSARLWDMRTGLTIAVLREGNERVDDGGFSADDRAVFTYDEANVARFWDVAKGKFHARTEPRRHTIPPAAKIDRSTRMSQDRLLNKLLVIEPQKPGELDGTLNYSVSPVELWDTDTGRLVAKFNAQGRDFQQFRFSGGGRWVTTTEGESTALVFSAQDGRLAARLSHPQGAIVRGVDASPTGKRVATFATEGGHTTLRIWDTESWRPEPAVMRLKRDHAGGNLQFWAEDTVAITSRDSVVNGLEGLFIYRLGRDEPIGEVSDYPMLWGLPPAVDGLIHRGNGQVFETRTWQRLRPPDGKRYHPALARFAPDGRFLVIAGDLGGDLLLDTRTEKAVLVQDSFFDELQRVVNVPNRGLATFRLVGGDATARILPNTNLDFPPNLLELWAQVAVRGELGPDGEFKKWDEATWEKKRQELAAIPAPRPDFPFPGYVATDKLHWLRAEFGEATTDADKLRLARDLLRRAEATGNRNEAVRWRAEIDRRVPAAVPPPREVKP